MNLHNIAKKGATPYDQEIGRRIRSQRIAIGMSQERLGSALGLTFQQIQKYEKGINRIASGRLQEISKILGVPMSFFFDDVKNDINLLLPLIQTDQSLRLLKAFAKIDKAGTRQALVNLAIQLAAADHEIKELC